ncbi:MAG: hypothetical protein J6V44_12735 [Methanobrevibacter sp.]|nr:hypothetical protein [Methanobrevibacter sp.]
MTQIQRDLLNNLLEVIDSQKNYSFGLDADSITQTFRMAKGYREISNAIYHILCADPNNEDRDYDAEQAEESINELRKRFK